jgi:hypothetical protein
MFMHILSYFRPARPLAACFSPPAPPLLSSARLARLLALLLLCCLPTYAHAMKNEPDGFRGLLFDSLVTEEDMILGSHHKDDPVRVYERKRELGEIYGVPTVWMHYCYYKNHLMSVHLSTTDTTENRARILRGLTACYGEPNEVFDSYIRSGEPHRRYVYIWRGEEVRIHYRVSPPGAGKISSSLMMVRIDYLPLWEKWRKEENAKYPPSKRG